MPPVPGVINDPCIYAYAVPADVNEAKVALLALYCNTSYRNADALLLDPVILNDDVVAPVVEIFNLTPDVPDVVKLSQHSMM